MYANAMGVAVMAYGHEWKERRGRVDRESFLPSFPLFFSPSLVLLVLDKGLLCLGGLETLIVGGATLEDNQP
jgi:hypothetical protein